MPLSMETKTGEFSRVIQLFSGKSGGKTSFPLVGLSVREAGGRTSVSVSHKSKTDDAALKAEWFGVSSEAGTAFDVATDQPDRLLDYLSNVFAPESPIKVAYDADAKRLVVHDGRRRASMGTVAFDSVLRPKPDEFGAAPSGSWVTSRPDRRPSAPANTEWAGWVAAGYTVASIPLTALGEMLKAGAVLYGHNYKGIVYNFTVHPDGLEVHIGDTKNPDAESVHMDRLDGATVFPGVGEETFAVRYGTVGPLWEPLHLVQSGALTLVHHPSEQRINFLASEDAADGTPILRLTESFMSWADPKANRPAKK